MKRILSEVKLLSEDEILLLHENSLKILEHTGMRVPNEAVCRMAQALGATVDAASMTVRIPPRAIEAVLAQVAQSPAALSLEEHALEPITGSVSTQIFRVDYQTMTRRYGTRQDVLDGIALIQGLDNIPRANAVVVPSDVPDALSDVWCYQNIYKYSQKPGGTYVLTPGSAKHILAMSRVMGREVSYLFDTISPLSFSQNSLEIALLFREQNMPLCMTPMVMAGSTGPISIAGLLALQNAEVLGSLFFIYAITGKIAPYVASGHTSDIRHNMFCSFGSPNQALIGAGVAQMARHYGLVSGSNSGLTDSIYPDFQCGFEKTLSAAVSCLAGTRHIGGQGIVGADQGFSFAQLVLDNEWLDSFRYLSEGIEVTQDSIGLETIEEVGIGGNFLSEDHTIDYMRESGWNSTLFDRDGWDALRARRESLLAAAEERAQELIAKNRVGAPVVSAQTAQALDEIYAAAEAELA